MKKLLLALLCLLSSTVSLGYVAPQETPQFGLGVMLGEPLGITGKLWIDRNSALDFGAGYSWNHYYNVLIDYLYHPKIHSWVRPYVGFGAEVFFYQDDYYLDWDHHHWVYYSDTRAGLGLRIPIGIELLPRDFNAGFFFEIAPGLLVTPEVCGYLQGYVGVRFYF